MWLKSKIQYPSRSETLTESYLHDALTYGEVESTCPELFISRIPHLTPTDHIDEIAKVKFIYDVLFFPLQDEDSFWKVKVRVLDVKKYTIVYLVAAVSDREASSRVSDQLKDWLTPWKIIAVDETDILAVYRPNNELWSGDWYNRMERLADEGKVEVVPEPVEKVPDPQVGMFPEDEMPVRGRKKGKKGGVDKAVEEYYQNLQDLAKDGTTVSVQTANGEWKPIIGHYPRPTHDELEEAAEDAFREDVERRDQVKKQEGKAVTMEKKKKGGKLTFYNRNREPVNG